MSNENDVYISNGNVFADLGLSNPEERLIKAELARKISEIIANRQLNQAQTAEVLGIDQPKISALTRGKLKDFSIDRLIRFINILGNDVEITIKPKPESRSIACTTVVCE
ncbi:helix-turn-helix transcriptional regulator [Nostoc sp. FACHB-888]|uniref:helix-turn-helix domain-containing protein n=1 Tax=Nostoc sp. FACHB-888 TaxID=2692842 RepID=UPI00168975F4|nr:helix-turn-helix transcriptional regulator [Nostoc sp. FACHB-888]MBD2243319.1 XRE family transcriptional regulator [Nostoc sp. FACHB-888]